MPKNTVINPLSGLLMPDVKAWYERYPLPSNISDTCFPLVQNRKSTTWKTIKNAQNDLNVLADPISLNSKVPVDGRNGFKTISGDMISFGKGRDMDADRIEEFEELKAYFAEVQNAQNAQALLDFYGADLQYVRAAVVNQKNFLSWKLISSACNVGFALADSPFLASLNNVNYGIESWQKDEVGTAWSDAAAEIVSVDIKNAVDVAKANNKVFGCMSMNETTFNYMRQNTEVQALCATLVQNLYDTQTPPNQIAIQTMLNDYFGVNMTLNVVKDVYTRMALNGDKNTANPFADNVVVFSASNVLGHFEWNGIPIANRDLETYESFFLVGSVSEVNPSKIETYSKARGMSVIDSAHDNFYLKTDAVAWS